MYATTEFFKVGPAREVVLVVELILVQYKDLLRTTLLLLLVYKRATGRGIYGDLEVLMMMMI